MTTPANVRNLFVFTPILFFCGGCDSGPDLPGPLPPTSPYPGPPQRPRAGWSELKLFDLKGEAISSLPVRTPFRAVLRLRLEEGYPRPEYVTIGLGLMHPEHGWVFGGMGGGRPGAKDTGEIRIECEMPGVKYAGKDWLVRGMFGHDHFVEVPLEVVDIEKAP